MTSCKPQPGSYLSLVILGHPHSWGPWMETSDKPSTGGDSCKWDVINVNELEEL